MVLDGQIHLTGRGKDLPAQFRRRADRLLAPFDRRDRPGFTVLVQRRGVTLYRKGFGLADLVRKTPMRPDAMFGVASVSKQFTAAGTLLLARRGRIGLDDDVRRWVPEVPRYRDPIRIRHLVWHTSGLRSMESFIVFGGLSFESAARRRILELVSRQRELNHRTGSEFRYCNTGYFLLHLVIERATGIPFETYMREAVFRPAGMLRTVVRDRIPFRLPGLVTGYLRTADGVFHRMPAGGSSPLGAAGASEVVSCVDDLGRWHEVLRRRDVFGAWFHREIHRRGCLRNGRRIDYAGGLFCSRTMGLYSVGHGGGMPGSVTITMRFPASGISVVVLGNCGDVPVGRIAYELAALAIRGKAGLLPSPWKEEPPRPASVNRAAPPDPALRRFEGLYAQIGGGNEHWTILPEGCGLRAKAQWGSVVMERAGEVRFLGREGAPESEFFFDLGVDGVPTGFREYKEGAVFKRFRGVANARLLLPSVPLPPPPATPRPRRHPRPAGALPLPRSRRDLDGEAVGPATSHRLSPAGAPHAPARRSGRPQLLSRRRPRPRVRRGEQAAPVRVRPAGPHDGDVPRHARVRDLVPPVHPPALGGHSSSSSTFHLRPCSSYCSSYWQALADACGDPAAIPCSVIPNPQRSMVQAATRASMGRSETR